MDDRATALELGAEDRALLRALGLEDRANEVLSLYRALASDPEDFRPLSLAETLSTMLHTSLDDWRERVDRNFSADEETLT